MVTSGENNGLNVNVYNISVINTIKNTAPTDIIQVYTSIYPSLCGTSFLVDTKYLIQGRYSSDGKAMVTMCSGSEMWNRLSEERTDVYRKGGYDCNCKIQKLSLIHISEPTRPY